MPFPIMAAAMIGAQLIKNKADAAKEARQRGVSAVQESVSPWTGMHGQQVQESDKVGGLIGAVSSGVAQHQAGNLADAQAAQQQNFQEQMMKQQEMDNVFRNKWLEQQGGGGQAFGGMQATKFSPYDYMRS